MTLATLMVCPACWTRTTSPAHRTSGLRGTELPGLTPSVCSNRCRTRPRQVPAVENRESRVAWDAASPLGPSPLSLGDSVSETSLSRGTVDSMGSSSARGSAEKGSDFPLTSKEERAVLPGRCPWTPLFTSSKTALAAPLCREADNVFLKPSQPTASTDAGCAVLQVSPVAETPPYDVMKEDCKCDLEEFVIVELGDFSNTTETCGCSCSSSKSVIYEPNFNSAELIAKELYHLFKKCWMSEVNYQLAGSLNTAGSIVVNEECVQKDFESSTDVVQEIKLKSRIRETGDWAPPRFQIIFNVHLPLKRDLMVAAQNFFCAGCGTPIEPKFVKRLRYCEYLGKYFCDCCHSYAESCIPARVLRMWDFRRYYVSNFSKRLLDSIWHQPVFNLLHVGHGLYTKAKELDRVREIQEQLFHIRKLLKTCRFAESTLKEFEQVPGHLTDELHLFSLEDLVRVKKGLLAPLLKDILKVSLAHVASCELCQGKGFICEFCRSTAVIFPFQTATCRRCSACRACFHKQCFQSSECPRCARITARRRLLESVPSVATSCP
ncbi:protein associated with UVRAG as autophagy enhancer isoform X3 [Kogia breviceps]|uniref:protein associated with UVRAG as autophagy enhancer isoform X3 n=1 Tax=Kogia breviceps TaxID=27615 RepID=UPI0034D1D28E